eukprot:m.27753 g.27753  ORF g.27753 m.27753 type:complete len:311 (+) comp6472_c0_seq1:213-1145(+)
MFAGASAVLGAWRAVVGEVKVSAQRLSTTAAAANGGYVWKQPAKVEELFPILPESTNRPTAGARTDKPVPIGAAPIQLYSLATPNGQKAGIFLEELEAAAGVQYDAHLIHIGKGTQFDKGFVDINPNSKIPAVVDRDPAGGGDPVRLFESGSILLYLAEKYGQFIPKDPRAKVEVVNWVFWQVGGQGPMTGSAYNHFVSSAPANLQRDYPVARYGMEVQRLLAVLDAQLEGKKYVCGDEYTIADMMNFTWFNMLRNGEKHKDFLTISQYKNLNRWADTLLQRKAVQRGLLVCSGKDLKPWLTDASLAHLK